MRSNPVDEFANRNTDGVQDPQIQQLMQQLTPQLMQVFEKVLGPPEDQLEDETKQHLISLVQRLRG